VSFAVVARMVASNLDEGYCTVMLDSQRDFMGREARRSSRNLESVLVGSFDVVK
jgi:hypothetical protein